MPKVLLIHTVFRKGTATSEPLSLEYLAAFLLERGIDVRICDENHQGLDQMFEEYQPDFLGISATTPNIERAYEICKQYRGRCKTIIGGVHATIFPLEAAEYCDHVVSGDGEVELLRIVKGYSQHKIEHGAPCSLDLLSPPARHLVDMKYYSNEMATRWFFGQGHPTTVVMTSRGCPFRCTYCWNSTRKEPVRYSSPEKVLAEIVHLIKEYGIRSFYFVDDDFLLPHSRFKQIAALLKPLGIRYSINSRSTSVSDEVLSAFKKSGGEFISFGFESGSQRILDVLNKRSTVENNINAINLCKKHGIAIMGWIMVGNPTETPADIEMSKRFIIENPIDFVTICITTAFPGTKMWEYCQENNLVPAGHKWSDYNMAEIANGWSPNTEMTRAEIVKAYHELVAITEKNKQKIKLSTAFRIFRNDPLGSLRYINRIGKLLRRLG